MAATLARKDQPPGPAVKDLPLARRATSRSTLDPLILALARAVDRQAPAPTAVPRDTRAD